MITAEQARARLNEVLNAKREESIASLVNDIADGIIAAIDGQALDYFDATELLVQYPTVAINEVRDRITAEPYNYTLDGKIVRW